MNLSKLQLFLTFIQADKRCSPQFMEEPKRKGIPVGELDFPLLRYTFSLENRLRMLTILRNEIHNSNEEAKEEFKRTQEKGSGTNENGLILTVYYESFLNQIYNIMENLAKVKRCDGTPNRSRAAGHDVPSLNNSVFIRNLKVSPIA